MKERLVFVQTNSPAGNQILVYDRADDGTLTLADTVSTGGNGGRHEGAVVDPLCSQGSLVYDAYRRVLVAVNAGSDTVSVLGLDDDRLCLRQVLPSGGTFPVSVTVHGDLLYVLNAHDTGAITGYRITDGQFHPIDDSTRSLELTPATGPLQGANTPAQVSFTPDGQQLVITTKLNGSLIDVFTVDSDGRPAEKLVANPAGFVDPFGFTFDQHGHLVVTDAASSTLVTYTIQPDGTIAQVAAEPNGQLAMCWVARVGDSFYVANAVSNTITGYHIDPAGTPTVFTQADTDLAPIDLTITPDGQFLYQQAVGAGNIDGYRINADGTLTQVLTLAAPSSMEGIAAT